jgi:hypothetical protein
MTRLDLGELASRSASAGLGVSGFVWRQKADAGALEVLRTWLLGLCEPGTAPCTLFDNGWGVNAPAYLLATAGHHLIGTDLGDQPSKEGDVPSSAWSHPDRGSVGGSLHVQTGDSPALPSPTPTLMGPIRFHPWSTGRIHSRLCGR